MTASGDGVISNFKTWDQSSNAEKTLTKPLIHRASPLRKPKCLLSRYGNIVILDLLIKNCLNRWPFGRFTLLLCPDNGLESSAGCSRELRCEGGRAE